jgi:hypothetical protein
MGPAMRRDRVGVIVCVRVCRRNYTYKSQCRCKFKGVGGIKKGTFLVHLQPS